MAAAGWYPDPRERHEHRYFDGTAWTDHVADDGRGSTDPVDVPSPARAHPQAASEAIASVRARQSGQAISTVGQYSAAARIAVFGGALALVIGAFLPWKEASFALLTVRQNGIDGTDGGFTLACGIGAAVLFGFVVSAPGRVITMLAGGLALLVTIYDIVDISRTADRISTTAGVFAVNANVGVGLWLSAAAAATIFLGAVLALRDAQ